MVMKVNRRERNGCATLGVVEVWEGPLRVFSGYTVEPAEPMKAGRFPVVKVAGAWEIKNIRDPYPISPVNGELQGLSLCAHPPVVDQDGLDASRSAEAHEQFMRAVGHNTTMILEIMEP